VRDTLAIEPALAAFARSGNSGLIEYRIAKGTTLAELPIKQPTKFELVINEKTAKALGVTIPPGVLARADDVVE
jgi:ABC-type uncharacterized transport system substrate-binding protein